MSQVLEDLSASALVRANEANLYAWTPFPHNWPQAEVYSGQDISWCITDIAFPSCNSIFRAHLEPENVDATIEALIAKGRARNVPLQWWIGHDTQPTNLGEYLVAHGFTHFGDGAGMAIDLLAMKEGGPMPANLAITEVKDSATLKTWCHTAAVGFGMPEDAEPGILKWFTTGLELKLPMKLYLAWWNGEPVATSQLLLAEGVAGIYFVATIPQARRRGAGFAITLKPLQAAREMGYRAGILQASKMGAPVYRRMGFKEYGKIPSYIWMHKPPGETGQST